MLAVAEAEASRPDGIAFDWYVLTQRYVQYSLRTYYTIGYLISPPRARV